MDPREFEILALRLARGSTAAELRTAVSRAYYAVFHVATEHLRRWLKLTEGPQAHGEVQRCLFNCGDRDVAAIGSGLAALHSLRIEADYRLSKRLAENRAAVQNAVDRAGRLIQHLDEIFAGPPDRQPH